jgi:UDP-N-acetylglucosamine--N-acetylmuramyl-(pentapeptide) pyrophosphoryl-undecaprenol N-acetylglucosamine transferase
MNRSKMKNRSRKIRNRIIISGGGTGGHVFPAIAIADALKEKVPGVEILFVGAQDRLEMEKIPEAGYRIVGLPVAGFRRKLSLGNITVIIKLLKSLKMARKILKEFDPDAVIGVGGYASGPVLRSAAAMGIPTLIQEQNSFAGITNRLLARKARCICVAFDGMEIYFPAEKIVKTGNPVRKEIMKAGSEELRKEGYKFFGLNENLKTLLVMGGSLGARTINTGMIRNLDLLNRSEIQVLWQSGRYYHEEAMNAIEKSCISNIILKDFISRMDLAYAVADLIISRAGAITISELSYAGKPAILVPSPNVAEDHQTKNANALVNKSAALGIPDNEAIEKMIQAALDLIEDSGRMKKMTENILAMKVENPAEKIAGEVLKLVQDDGPETSSG